MAAPHETGNSRSLSYWIDTTASTSFPPLGADDKADVCVVGGGIAGITAAYLLAKAGTSVIVLDRERVAMAETGHTTAHLQIVLDTRLSDLVPRFGLDGTKLAWDSQLEAVNLIESIAREHRISCELERLPAYLYSPHKKDKKLLKEELRLTRKIGYEAEWASPDEIPFPAEHAIKFPDQGKFHVRKYLLGVVKAAQALGVRFHEGTEVSDVKSGRHVVVETRHGARVKAKWLLCCTNTPIVGRETIHAKVEAYRTYAIGALVPRGVFGEALYWDTLDPYHYTRVERRGEQDLVIHGGEDHLVGDVEDTESRWAKVYDHLREATTESTLAYRWSGEIMETADDMPYIGRIPGRGKNELMVTGDSGTGMTNGTIGALMLAEHVLGRGTPWDELYDPARIEMDMNVAKETLRYNLHAGKRFVKGALMRGEIADIAELQLGEGAIVKQGMRPIAVSRLEDGTLCAVSGVCTHVGCTVAWNHGEQSWDCPCHGSRFTPKGEILHGPARDPLAPVDLEGLLDAREDRVEKQAGRRS
ncbi:MAG TPA: FAD-dependent oxidoreductase [Candidatus Thermoplasmatota archaeon]|nr:FAD-dependent oxidoreductase [Candidatus Thermoplasmatota archaeon]